MTGPKLTAEEAAAIVAKTAAPKVTAEHIEGKIGSVSFLRDGVLVVCIITMQNGFKVLGKSAPASVENFDEDVGQSYAYQDAFRQIYALEGYLLRQQLFDKEAAGHVGRS